MGGRDCFTHFIVKNDMKHRFGLIKRPWGIYYSKDRQTGQQETLSAKQADSIVPYEEMPLLRAALPS
jgi:hypothetical protein